MNQGRIIHMNNKDKKMIEVTLALFRNYSKNKKLNISHIASSCNVSRSWIYKYFGNNEDDMYLQAVDIFTPEIRKFDRELEEQISKEGWINYFLGETEKRLDDLKSFEEVHFFYFNACMQSPVLRERIKFHESQYLMEQIFPLLKSAFPHLKKDQLIGLGEALMIFRLGLLFKWLHEPIKSEDLKAAYLKKMKIYLAMGK